MKLSVPVSVALALLATPVVAQSTAKLKKEVRKLERAAKKDPDKLFEAGKYADEVGLAKQAKSIFQKVLKLAPDHEGANRALGFEKVEGKWIPAAEAEKLRAKALEAEYSAKGFENVDGIWVEPDLIADAKKGLFHHDDEIVSRDEKAALQRGMVRHPRLGILISAEHAEKAKNGYFPLGDGKWGDLKEADKFHSDIERPWLIRSTYATVVSTLPLEKLEALLIEVDKGQEYAEPIFGHRKLHPEKRPLIMIAKSQSEYRSYGAALSDGTDVAGAFLMSAERDPIRMPHQGEVRAAVCDNHKDWGTRYIRHAAAISYANAIAEDAGTDLPLWFIHGVGSMASRFETDPSAGWLGKQHVAKGGVMSLKSWFSGFELSSDLDPQQVGYNLYQAGLMLSFAMRGGDDEVTNAMLDITKALSGKGGSSSKAVRNLEKLLISRKAAIVKHLEMLISKSQ